MSKTTIFIINEALRIVVFSTYITEDDMFSFTKLYEHAILIVRIISYEQPFVCFITICRLT